MVIQLCLNGRDNAKSDLPIHILLVVIIICKIYQGVFVLIELLFMKQQSILTEIVLIILHVTRNVYMMMYQSTFLCVMI